MNNSREVTPARPVVSSVLPAVVAAAACLAAVGLLLSGPTWVVIAAPVAAFIAVFAVVGLVWPGHLASGRAPEVLEKTLAAPVLFSLPRSGGGKATAPAMLIDGPIEGPVADAYRRLRSMLSRLDDVQRVAAHHAGLPRRADGVAPVVLITSTSEVGPDERLAAAGNLAIAAASASRQVTLIEADLVRPAVARLLGIGGDRGTGDASSLRRRADGSPDLRPFLQPTIVPGLVGVGQGTPPAVASDALAQLGRFMAAVARQSDLVVVHGPPLDRLDDVIELLAYTDQLVAVAGPDATVDQTKSLRRLVDQLHAPLTGVLLSPRRLATARWRPSMQAEASAVLTAAKAPHPSPLAEATPILSPEPDATAAVSPGQSPAPAPTPQEAPTMAPPIPPVGTPPPSVPVAAVPTASSPNPASEPAPTPASEAGAPSPLADAAPVVPPASDPASSTPPPGPPVGAVPFSPPPADVGPPTAPAAFEPPTGPASPQRPAEGAPGSDLSLPTTAPEPAAAPVVDSSPDQVWDELGELLDAAPSPGLHGGGPISVDEALAEADQVDDDVADDTEADDTEADGDADLDGDDGDADLDGDDESPEAAGSSAASISPVASGDGSSPVVQIIRATDPDAVAVPDTDGGIGADDVDSASPPAPIASDPPAPPPPPPAVADLPPPATAGDDAGAEPAGDADPSEAVSELVDLTVQLQRSSVDGSEPSSATPQDAARSTEATEADGVAPAEVAAKAPATAVTAAADRNGAEDGTGATPAEPVDEPKGTAATGEADEQPDDVIDLRAIVDAATMPLADEEDDTSTAADLTVLDDARFDLLAELEDEDEENRSRR